MIVSRKVLTLIIFIFVTVFPPLLRAQEPVTVKKSENKVIIEGKVYFIHVVKPGQTLYSISKAYNVTEKDIAIENPGVYSGLRIGQMLKIPEEVPVRPKDDSERRDTTKYIYHVLKQGENLFALSRLYNVSPDAIREANPDLDYTNLQIGRVILIPRAQSVYNDEDFILHKVRRRDTLYGIAKRYDTGIDVIKKYNPELQWGDLKTGQIIRIPKPESAEAMEGEEGVTALHPDTVSSEMTDTVPGLSLDDYAASLPFYHGKQINVAFLIPFAYTDEVSDSKENEEEIEMGQKEIDEARSDLLPESAGYLEFMQGSLLAIDSLRKNGMSLNIHYFDTRKSPARMRQILASPFFRDVDLIIGPFFSWNVEIVNDFSMSRHVPMVCPFYASDNLTGSNPYMFQLNPSYTTEYGLAAQYLARDFDKNFVFLYGSDSIERNKIEYFKGELLRSLQNFTYPENAIVKEIVYDNIARADISSDLSQALSKDKKNIVVIPVTDEAFVSAVVSQLYFLSLKEFDIQVFGLAQWPVFPNSDFQSFHKLGLTYITPCYYSFDDPRVKKFLAKFRAGFKAEPTFTTRNGCPYAFLGYDATFAFLDAIGKNDNQFAKYILNSRAGEILPSYRFRRKSTHGGFENQSLKIVHFNNDYTVTVREVALEQEDVPALSPRRIHIDTGRDTVPDFRK